MGGLVLIDFEVGFDRGKPGRASGHRLIANGNAFKQECAIDARSAHKERTDRNDGICDRAIGRGVEDASRDAAVGLNTDDAVAAAAAVRPEREEKDASEDCIAHTT